MLIFRGLASFYFRYAFGRGNAFIRVRSGTE